MDIFLIVACLYMAYTSVEMALEVPFAEWGFLQYALLLLTVGLLFAAGYRLWQNYKQRKEKRAAEAAEGGDIEGQASGEEGKMDGQPEQKTEAEPSPKEPAAEDAADTDGKG